MKKYIIIETTATDAPENTNQQVSTFFDTFAEAMDELTARFNASENKKGFNQSVTSIEL